jgi:hypothetical protein
LSGGREKKILDSRPTSAAFKQEREYRADFQERASGNPAGRPSGARHKTTIVLEALLDGQAQRLTEMAVEVAMAAPPTSMISPPTEIINAAFDAGRPP